MLLAAAFFLKSKRVLIITTAFYMIFLGSNILIYMCVFWSFGLDIPLLSLLTGVPMLMLIAMIPISIQGRGVSEWLAVWMWSGGAASKEQVLAVVLTVYFLILIQGMFAGVIWMLFGGKLKQLKVMK